MFRIAISVIGNIASTSGTTVRARSIMKIIRSRYEFFLITRATSVDDKLFTSLNVKKPAVKLVKPERTRLWNLKLIPIILHHRFNVVYCVADLFGFITYYLLSKLLRYKIIFEAHALAHREKEQISKMRSMIYLLLEVFIARKANAVIALSGVTYSFYHRLNENTFFIPVFIDDKLFRNCSEKTEHATKKVAGLIGPFATEPNKYQLDFLYTNLDKFDEKTQFLVIGECDERLTSSRVKYTGYLEPIEEYVRVLCQLDALLVPVKFATFGPKNKILEAMACSLPVFTSPQGVVGLDFAEPDKNILVYEDTKLVQKINELLFDEESMKKIRQNARATVERFYAESIYKAIVLNIVKRVAING